MIQFGDPRLPERFWAKVQPEPMSGCWLWTGAQTKYGHGQLKSDGKMRYAHRLSFLVENVIQTGLVVDHKCRVPYCVNPAHLQAITQKENVLIGIAPPALNARKAVCTRGHDLSGDGVRRRGTRRYCMACDRVRSNAYFARKGSRDRKLRRLATGGSDHGGAS